VSHSRLCARGLASHEAPSWGERLTKPLVSRGGELREASWEEALTAAAAGLNAVRARGDMVGVLASGRATNEECYLAARLARGALGSPHVDECLGGPFRALLRGLARISGEPGGHGGIEEIARCQTIVLVEGDVATTHPQVAAAVMRALRRGARLVTLGATRTRMARLASLWIRLVPGRERATTAALAGAALSGGRIDTAVVAATPEGLDAARASVAGVAVSAEARQAASWYAAARAAALVIAPFEGEAQDLEELGADLATLAAVTGHCGRAGSVLLALPLRGNQRGAAEVGAAPDWLPGYAALADDAAARRLATAWGDGTCRERGAAAADILAGARGLVIVAEDVTATLPAGGLPLRGATDRFLVVMEAFATPTVTAASVVLPIACFAENAGTVTNLEGRVQRIRQVVPPPGMARPGWEVLAELGRRLGDAMAYRSADDVRHEIGRVVPRYGAIAEADLDSGWGALPAGPAPAAGWRLTALAPLRPAPEEKSLVAFAECGIDWGRDPHVTGSPTLRREPVAQRKLYPRGVIGMSKQDMDALGVRAGWPVKVSSPSGEVVVPVLPREELGAGLVLVPATCREELLPVMGARGAVEVTVARVERG